MATERRVYGRTNPIWLAVVIGLSVALLLSNVWVTMRLAAVERRFAALETGLKETRVRVDDVRTKSEVSTRAAGRTLAAVRDELQKARQDADTAVGDAKAIADRRVTELASELTSREGLEKQHRQELQRLNSELSKMTDAASKADEKIGEVKTEVVAVKNALEADHSAMERNISELRRVKGDLGVQSGLIATNARELAALKAVNERNYYDVDLPMRKAQIVAGVTLVLKNADVKRFQYSIDVVANDKRTEKKHKSINEPVQFVVNKTKGPYHLEADDLYELVINEVSRDAVKGYLATPKLGTVASAAVR